MLSLTAAALNMVLGGSRSIQFGTLSIFELVIFVIVLGEELGWRGFALPKLLERALGSHRERDRRRALGTMASADLPGAGHTAVRAADLAFVLMTTAYSVLICWIYVHTAGSVLLATLVHARNQPLPRRLPWRGGSGEAVLATGRRVRSGSARHRDCVWANPLRRPSLPARSRSRAQAL